MLAACSGGSFLAEREPWRKEAEARCIGSGTVQEGAGIVRVRAINGPGACGADFPMKVSMLGQSSVLGFGAELRPPASIPNVGRPAPPRWPIVEPSNELPPYQPPRAVNPAPTSSGSTVYSRPLPPPQTMPSAPHDGGAQPMSIDPPAAAGPPQELYDFRRPYGAAPSSPARIPARAPMRAAPVDPGSPAYDLSPEPYEQRRVIDSGQPRAARPSVQTLPPAEAAPPAARVQRRAIPALGPSRAPRVTGATHAIAIKPAATLACPMVAAVDEWLATTVQPAALRWFNQPVVEIRQISAYSCRGMNGNPRARISEHAFGNALDIASFTLADGRKITVKGGWRGRPEEQGFLRDVQGGACSRFTTVLAPGSNRFHYDHFHIDLMRRAGGRRACNPRAVSGEEVAARARAHYARRGGDPSVTGSVKKKRVAPTAFAEEEKVGHVLPRAVPGEDGED